MIINDKNKNRSFTFEQFCVIARPFFGRSNLDYLDCFAKNARNDARGFTLTEIMIVVFLIGIIAAFGLPSYQKALDKARIRDAIIQLTGLHAASKIYNAQADGFWPGPGASITDINNGLGINLIAQDASTDFNYTASPAGCDNLDPATKCTGFTAATCWPFSGANCAGATYTVTVTEIPIATSNIAGISNPCCTATSGSCPLNPC